MPQVRWCQHSKVTIGPYELCLSPHVIKSWRQKEINPFVSETTEYACICIIIIIEIIMSIKHLFDFVSWPGFWELRHWSRGVFSFLKELQGKVQWYFWNGIRDCIVVLMYACRIANRVKKELKQGNCRMIKRSLSKMCNDCYIFAVVVLEHYL